MPSGAARPSGYNPVQQLPDGQIQNVPVGGIPSGSTPANNFTETPIIPSNPSVNNTETVGGEPNMPPGMKGEGGQEEMTPPPSSAGNKLVKGASSAFAAAVAMLVMSVV